MKTIDRLLKGVRHLSNFGEGGIVEPDVDKDVPVLLTPNEMEIVPNRMIEIESKSKERYESLEVFSCINGIYISQYGQYNKVASVAVDPEDLAELIEALQDVLKIRKMEGL